MPTDPLKREQFDVEKLLKSNEFSPKLIQRVADLLEPEIVLRKPYQEQPVQINRAKLASQLLWIDIESNDVFARSGHLKNWIKNIGSNYAVEFLNQLIVALESVLDDAIRAGIEFKDSLGKSDFTVRSIAEHPQDNLYRAFIL